MGLKFSDALRLSWSNIAQHKKRSTLIVITVSVLFTIIFGLNLIFQGVENTVLDTAMSASNGKIYVETGFVPAYDGVDDYVRYLPSNADEIVRSRLERYHGEYVGKVTEYEFEIIEQRGKVTVYTPDNYQVINYGAVADFCTTQLTDVPKGKLPVLLMRGATLSKEEAETFYAVGELPLSDQISLALPGDFNLLNLALGDSAGLSDSDFARDFLIVEDENSEAVADFVAKRAIEMQRQQDQIDGSIHREVGVREQPVAVFTNAQDFVSYYNNTSAEGHEYGYTCDYAQNYLCKTRDLFGNAASVAAAFMGTEYLLMLAGVFLLVIAACIAAITFSHVIDEDASTIALYRAMGASTSGIYLVYFCYLVELCLLAIVVCIMVSLFFAGGLAITSAGELGKTLQRAYKLTEAPAVWMIGFNAQLLLTLMAILLVAPLTLLMTWRRFSAKHVAKKLKED